MSTLKKIGVAAGGCLGVAVLMIAVLAAVLYYGFKQTDAAISPKIDGLFVAIEEGDFAETYDTETTSEYRAAASLEQHVEIGKAIALQLGPLKSKSLQAYKLNQHNSRTVLEVTYGAVFQEGPGTILAKFEKQDGVWKILSFRVESKRFEQRLLTRKCPKCGGACTGNDRFCPACGVELPLAEEDANGPAEAQAANRV